jgi:hypothetical protein
MCDDCCECSPEGTCGTVWHNFNVAATWFVLATPLMSACPLGIGYALVALGEVVYLCFGVLMCSVEPRDGSATATAIWLREVTPFGWTCAERHTAWRCVPTFWFPFSFWSELVVDVGTIILAYEELGSGCADWAVVIVTVFTALVKSIVFLVSVWASCMPSTRNGGPAAFTSRGAPTASSASTTTTTTSAASSGPNTPRQRPWPTRRTFFFASPRGHPVLELATPLHVK